MHRALQPGTYSRLQVGLLPITPFAKGTGFILRTCPGFLPVEGIVGFPATSPKSFPVPLRFHIRFGRIGFLFARAKKEAVSLPGRLQDRRGKTPWARRPA